MGRYERSSRFRPKRRSGARQSRKTLSGDRDREDREEDDVLKTACHSKEDRDEREQLPAQSRTLEREGDHEQSEASGRERDVLRHERPGVGHRRQEEDEPEQAECELGTHDPPRPEVDRDGCERHQQRVDRLREPIGGRRRRPQAKPARRRVGRSRTSARSRRRRGARGAPYPRRCGRDRSREARRP